MQFALALGIATAIGLGAYAVYRARKAEQAADLAGQWALTAMVAERDEDTGSIRVLGGVWRVEC